MRASASLRNCGPPVVLLGRHSVIVVKAFRSLKIALRLAKVELAPAQDRPLNGLLLLEGTRIDLEQEVSLANNRTFLEMHALQVAGNSRTNLDCVYGFEPAGELIAVADLLAGYFRYAHFHWTGDGALD